MKAAACTVTPAGRGLAAIGCPSAAARRDALQALAEGDAREPAVRAIALSIVAALPVLSPSAVGPALWSAVRSRVRYVGEVAPDLWSHSLTTWRTRAGDCDDSARLLVALALSLGLGAEVVTLDRPDGSGHATAIVWDGAAWRWADPSVPGARWGEAPEDAYRRAGSMWPRGVSRETGLGAMRLPVSRHQEIRGLLISVLGELGIAPTAGTLQALQAVALQESTYGAGWSGPMKDSHNMGAIQASKQGTPCPPGSAPNGDRHADGSTYTACYRTYSDDRAGLLDLVRFIFKNKLRAAAFTSPTSADVVGEAMVRSGYAEQIGPSCRCDGCSKAEKASAMATPACLAERIEAESAALWNGARSVATALGEPLILVRSPRPSPRPSAASSVVAVGLVGVVAGGVAWWVRRRGARR